MNNGIRQKFMKIGVICRKSSVGRLELTGECEYGCAKVRMKSLRVLKINGDLVWEKILS